MIRRREGGARVRGLPAADDNVNVNDNETMKRRARSQTALKEDAQWRRKV